MRVVDLENLHFEGSIEITPVLKNGNASIPLHHYTTSIPISLNNSKKKSSSIHDVQYSDPISVSYAGPKKRKPKTKKEKSPRKILTIPTIKENISPYELDKLLESMPLSSNIKDYGLPSRLGKKSKQK